MFFRGIYFPQRNARVWTKLVAQNHRPLFKLFREGVSKYREGRKRTPVATIASSPTN
jgi:hypothetical protein